MRRRDRMAQFPPLTPAGLRGKVALASFWTYTFINWLSSDRVVSRSRVP
jgi:hypothetical protein